MTEFSVGSLVKAGGREWVMLPESEEDLLVLRLLGGTDDEIAGIYLPLETVEPAFLACPLTHLGIYGEAQRLLLKVQGKIEDADQKIFGGIVKLKEIGNEYYIEDFERALGPVQIGLFVIRPEQPLKQKTLPGW